MSDLYSAEIVGLYCYPIKSCGQVKLTSSELNPLGLAYDRQWMLVDEKGQFLSQRTWPQLGLIALDLDPKTGTITASAKGMNAITISASQSTEKTDVTVWKDSLKANVAATHINQWFSQYLQIPVRLVSFGETSQRLIEADYNPGDKQVAFADGYPLLVTHQATLEQLNQQLLEQNHPKVAMQRFRANIVLKTSLPAQDEYHWATLSNPNTTIDLIKPCSRCVMTNLDPETAEKTGNKVLSTLAKKHRLNNKATFGINGWAQQTTQIRVGDRLQISHQKTTKSQL